MEANRLTDLAIDFVSLVDEPAHPEARVVLTKRDDTNNQQDTNRDGDPFTIAQDNTGGVMSDEFDDITTELQKSVETLTEQRDVANDRVAALEETVAVLTTKIDEFQAAVFEEPGSTEGAEEAPVPEGENVDKSALPASVRKMIEDTERRAAAAEAAVQKMADEAHLRDHIEKAADFDRIAKADELGPVLADVAKNAPQSYERLEHFLKTAQSRINLTTEIGKAGGGDGASDGELTALVAKRMQAEGVSEAEALAQVLYERPDLYTSPTTLVAD